MKVGDTGTFFVPGLPWQLGEFIPCRILEILGDKLIVELECGETREVPTVEFTPQYFRQTGDLG